LTGVALGLWVCGCAVFLGDAKVLEFCLEAGAAAAAAAPGEPDGVDHAVVDQRRSWRAMDGNRGPERGQHDSCGDPVVGGDRQRVAGAVIEPGDDLHTGAGAAVGRVSW